jgi:hypothetical protein
MREADRVWQGWKDAGCAAKVWLALFYPKITKESNINLRDSFVSSYNKQEETRDNHVQSKSIR